MDIIAIMKRSSISDHRCTEPWMSKTRSSLKQSISRTETNNQTENFEKPLHWLREKRNQFGKKK
jgi:hypothetical protein